MSNSRIGSAQRRGQFAFQSKALQEEAIVRRREASRQRNEFWDTTSKYFERYHRCVESSLQLKEKKLRSQQKKSGINFIFEDEKQHTYKVPKSNTG